MLLDGIFADGASEQRSSLPGMSLARFTEFEKAHQQSLNSTRAFVHAAMRPGAVLIANGLHNYATNGSEDSPYVDGYCFEQ